MPNRHQAIIWTNADPIHCCIYAALRGDDWRTPFDQFAQTLMKFVTENDTPFWLAAVGGTHYDDVIMGAIASLITSITSVCSTVYSDADQKIHQSSASLAFVWGLHRDLWIPRTKGQLRGKCFHLMTSSCNFVNSSLPGLNGRHFAGDVFTCIFIDEKSCILIRISLKFVP